MKTTALPPDEHNKRSEVAETTYRLKNSGGSLVTNRTHPVHGLCECEWSVRVGVL